MTRPTLRKVLTLAAVFFGLWVVIRYFLPVLMPFLLGGGLALAAEPLVRFLSGKLRLGRGIAAGIGITMAFALLVLALMLLGALAVRELSLLSGILPQAQEMVRTGLGSLQDLFLSLAARLPESISTPATQAVLELFSGGAALLSKITGKLLGLATGLLGRIPDGALGFGTALISSYMISAKLPDIKDTLRRRVPVVWKEKYLPALHTVKDSVFSYLKAQCKLAGATFLIVAGGLLVLGIRLVPLWAFLIALVDAVPLLGTGTVMIPWALAALVQGAHARAIGLTAIYLAAVITRSVLEPRLIGKQMGIDPLVTLVALYLGYRLWGVLGMLLAPMATATAIRLSALNAE